MIHHVTKGFLCLQQGEAGVSNFSGKTSKSAAQERAPPAAPTPAPAKSCHVPFRSLPLSSTFAMRPDTLSCTVMNPAPRVMSVLTCTTRGYSHLPCGGAPPQIRKEAWLSTPWQCSKQHGALTCSAGNVAVVAESSTAMHVWAAGIQQHRQDHSRSQGVAMLL